MGIISNSVNNSFKNKVNKKITLAKNSYFKSTFDTLNSNMRRRWILIGQLVGKNFKNKMIKKLIFEDRILSGDLEMAELFNSYFCNIAQNLRNNLPTSSTTPDHYLNPPPRYNFSFRTVSLVECEKIVSDLKPTKTNVNFIPVNLLKQYKKLISKPLTCLLNECLRAGKFPESFKIARVTPIFKKGDETNCSNYRPISCLPVFSKIFERLVVNQLLKFSDENKILSENQFGFRKKISTSDALTHFTEYVYQGLDNRKFILSVLLDLTKAFDTVDVPILLTKLEFYGVRDGALRWFKNYLFNRKQFVCINGINSKIRQIHSGVPQGSILGPILFLFYINDLPKAIYNSRITLFADDSTLSFCDRDQSSLVSHANSQLVNAYEWCLANKLTLNKDKTEIFLVTNKSFHSNTPINLGGQNLNFKSNCKFLGVVLDDGLTFKNHITSVIDKISKLTGLLYRIRHLLNLDTKLNFYYSLMYPFLSYNILVWGGACHSHLDGLVKIQKRIIRLILNEPFYAHTTPLFRKLGILKISDIYKYNLCIYMFNKATNNYYSVQHEVNTRNRNLCVPRFCRLTSTQKSVSFSGPTVWNSLPEHLKSIDRIHIFKTQLKSYLLNQYS